MPTRFPSSDHHRHGWLFCAVAGVQGGRLFHLTAAVCRAVHELQEILKQNSLLQKIFHHARALTLAQVTKRSPSRLNLGEWGHGVAPKFFRMLSFVQSSLSLSGQGHGLGTADFSAPHNQPAHPLERTYFTWVSGLSWPLSRYGLIL